MTIDAPRKAPAPATATLHEPSRAPAGNVRIPSFSRADGIAPLDGVRGIGAHEIAVARLNAAASIEALHRIYNGIDRASPARELNQGRPVDLRIPHDLNAGFRAFLADPARAGRHFHDDDPRALPGAHGTLTAGDAVTYSMHEVPRTRDGRRHVVVTVGGLTSGDVAHGATPARAWANRSRVGHQSGEIARLAVGMAGEMGNSVARSANSFPRRNVAIRRCGFPSTVIRSARKPRRKRSKPSSRTAPRPG